MEILLKYFPRLSPIQKQQYGQLIEEIMSWNQRINLISRKDTEHLAERHILHSLGIAMHVSFASGERVLDVGTGGGFPGLPLAIMFPAASFTLIDSIGKKINAVSEISRSLKLENVRCLQLRAEDYPGRVQYVVSRAVAGLDRFTVWISDKFDKDPGPTSGLWYLKGGDLEEELQAFPEAVIYDLKKDFSESFFESKKLVWMSPNSLR
ncbi:16S rRNA (guanine(527)-N(7))-methyltransferase RsmG [Bacteroidota bacterium]